MVASLIWGSLLAGPVAIPPLSILNQRNATRVSIKTYRPIKFVMVASQAPPHAIEEVK
jgi:hypothetical protein